MPVCISRMQWGLWGVQDIGLGRWHTFVILFKQLSSPRGCTPPVGVCGAAGGGGRVCPVLRAQTTTATGHESPTLKRLEESVSWVVCGIL